MEMAQETVDSNAETPLQQEIFEWNGRSIEYYLAAAAAQDRPILVILHGHGYGAIPAKFRSPSWNVLCPMDRFGNGGLGSWYLGEQGDLFWLGAMSEIIRKVRERVGIGRIYFWGSSMGGYGALLHGYRNGASAIYANIPQTILLGSAYSDGGMRKYFEPIFGSDGESSSFNDLRNIYLSRSRMAVFLCFNQLERANYLNEQCMPFISHLHAMRQRFYLEVRPLDGHGKNHGISETLRLFSLYK